ncbi:MAG: ATP synthase F1 subunit delta [Candidatus Bipolaricaulia bacterium]
MRSREIAKRYARALHAVAVEEGTVVAIEEELQSVVREMKEVEDFERFLTHPLISREKKTALVVSAFPDLSTYVANTIRLLIRNRREGYIDLIYDEFLEARATAEKYARVRVVTAQPLSDDDRLRLKERLEAALGRAVNLEDRLEEGLLAGARIEVEGKTIDATLRANLSELRSSLER